MFTNPGSKRTGKVYLVGAGPGDPDLLTVRAVRTLGFADIVLYDALVSAEVLALIPPRARVMNVGKRCGQKSITQEEINDLLVGFASAGEAVVRLKSGDPSIFGRAGEELDAIREAGIEVEIVPGVTACLAAAAKMGVSLTDRRRADQILFISAHRGQGKQNSDWHALVNRRTTVVVYMPGEYEGVAEGLQKAGLSESTPCAIVSNVSSPDWNTIQPGQTLDVSLTGWSTGPSPSWWQVGTYVTNASGGMQGAPVSIESGPTPNRVGWFGSCPHQPIADNAGSTGSPMLKFTAPAGVQSGDWAVVEIDSFRQDDSAQCAAKSGSDMRHFWFVGFYVP